MPSMTRSVHCPVCGAQAGITLFENRNLDTEGHEIQFHCEAGRHKLTDVEMLRLWGAARMETHS